MRIDFLLAFTNAAKSFFEEMFKMEINEQDISVCEFTVPDKYVSSILFLGDVKGGLLLAVEKDFAWEMATLFVGNESVEESDVRDVLGEIANIIAGHAKKNIQSSLIELSLPLVSFQDKNESKEIKFPNNVTCTKVIFETKNNIIEFYCGIEEHKLVD